MSAPLLYVTGTNTAVGKTTLACLLLRRARERNLRIAAMKPFCSGGRDDAEKLHALQTAGLTLDEVNPFHFAEPVTPYIAARNENRVITLAQTIDSIQTIQTRHHPLLIEGAGGLMSPLGERFTLFDIIQKLPGKICIVAPNILGVINAALLTRHALNQVHSDQIRFVLMNPPQRDAAASTNAEMIEDWTGAAALELPFLSIHSAPTYVDKILEDLLAWWI
jgi:dethiobiotin synthetase